MGLADLGKSDDDEQDDSSDLKEQITGEEDSKDWEEFHIDVPIKMTTNAVVNDRIDEEDPVDAAVEAGMREASRIQGLLNRKGFVETRIEVPDATREIVEKTLRQNEHLPDP